MTIKTTTAEIHLGHGLTAPEGALPSTGKPPAASRADHRPEWGRVALAAAAILSPVAMAAQYALNSAGLPRQDAEIYLAAIAADRSGAIASTIAYGVAMATMVAVAAVAAIALRRRASGTTVVAAALLTLGAVGGGAFVGLRLAAIALVEDGRVVAGGVAAFTHLQDGVINPVGLLLICAILGTLLLAVAMLQSRREIGYWPALFTVIGFILASGEFPTPVSVLGALVQGSALVPVVRIVLRTAH